MLEKDFVPYEEALALKELGFDEKCFCNWEESWSPEPKHEIRMVLTTDQTWLRPGWINAPTFSQAFRWFREEYKIDAWAVPFKNLDDEKQYSYIIDELSFIEDPEDFYTYEEAELECLKKLIEFVKDENVK